MISKQINDLLLLITDEQKSDTTEGNQTMDNNKNSSKQNKGNPVIV